MWHISYKWILPLKYFIVQLQENKGENDALKNYFLFLFLEEVKDDIQLSRVPASGGKTAKR